MQVMWDNGSTFLYLDGACHYWVQGGVAWDGVRTGTLTGSEQDDLKASIQWSSWAGAYGNRWPAVDTVDDAADLYFTKQGSFVVSSVCDRTSAPATLKVLCSAWTSQVSALWQRGVPLEAEVWTVLVRMDSGTYPSIPHASWPLSVPLATLSINVDAASNLGYGEGVHFLGSDAKALRSLRTMYQDGNYRTQGVLGLPVDGEKDAVDLLFLRDALPFEDSRGLVRP
ncbi:MAG: hypothetical protein JST92_16825 [Deltaproteobacteria bacterium]|nr:hypothetical protein [Deltaproteobacteria bacterium]